MTVTDMVAGTYEFQGIPIFYWGLVQGGLAALIYIYKSSRLIYYFFLCLFPVINSINLLRPINDKSISASSSAESSSTSTVPKEKAISTKAGDQQTFLTTQWQAVVAFWVTFFIHELIIMSWNWLFTTTDEKPLEDTDQGYLKYIRKPIFSLILGVFIAISSPNPTALFQFYQRILNWIQKRTPAFLTF